MSPTFDFRCDKCEIIDEKTFIVNEKVINPKCPKCKKKMRKMIPSKINTSGFQRTKWKKIADNMRPPRPEDKGLL